ncbi:MAG: hypothetical protein GX477_06020 [Clostridiaceae bacterium]|nr:hypothetical protein [Clostridiaceae bacterium]
MTPARDCPSAYSRYDPQAYVLRPDVVFAISSEIIKEDTPFRRSRAAALAAVSELRSAVGEGRVIIDERETSWLDAMEAQLESVPDDEEQFISEMLERCESDKFDPKKYDL